MSTIIARNNTGSNISIEDLGITIDTVNDLVLTDIFTMVEVCISKDLKTYIYSDSIIINDGVGWLTIAGGIKHTTLETEFGDDIELDIYSGTYRYFPVDGYSYSIKLTIDHQKVIGTEDLENFPLMISLTEDWLKEVGYGGYVDSTNGYDIIFTDINNNQFDHEIEKYDGVQGEIVAWVRIPLLTWDANVDIYINCGNPGIVTSQENITGVWDSNFKGVWHLSETPDADGGTDEILDSTINDNDGNNAGMDSTNDQVDGKIDGAIQFDGGGSIQYARPDSDVAGGIWSPSSGSDLYAMIDEETASDTDYIYTQVYEDPDPCEIGLSSVTDPVSSSGHIVRYRRWAGWYDEASTIELYCGATLIASWSYDNSEEREIWETIEHTLTAGQADNITDYSDLRLKFEKYDWAEDIRVSWAEFEVPTCRGRYIDIGNVGNSVKTVSFWMKADDITSMKIIDINGTAQIEINGSSDIVATGFPAATVYVDGVAATAVTTGWHFITITDTTGVNATDVDIGRASSEFFEGIIDEVRISNTARSAEWIKTSYNNQSSPETFYSIIDSTSEESLIEAEIIQIYDSDGGTNINNVTPTAIPFGSETCKNETVFTHSNTIDNSKITVDEKGLYRIGYTINWYENNTSNANIRARIRKNGGYYVQYTSYGSGDLDNREESTCSSEIILRLEQNDYIEIVCDRVGGITATVYTEANASWLYMEKLQD